FIVIKVAVTLEEEFTEELKNTSSPVYQELERYITVELYETFKDTPNFQEVVVLGFRNGSVIVDFKAVYRKDKNNKIVVAESVREQIVKAVKLGNYQVKSAVVQGRPPPPAGLKETGKTDNSIDISWVKPKGHSAFDIDGYMVGHKTYAETQYKNQNISATSGMSSAVLTGLESDTIYEITVHAYNNDGHSDKLKIQVTTEKPDDSTTVVIIVVVIVIVLLLIIAMVVFFQLRKRRYRYEVDNMFTMLLRVHIHTGRA
ncbi:angiopoietin-1 receptor-like, partial [Paramuricea clavata]